MIPNSVMTGAGKDISQKTKMACRQPFLGVSNMCAKILISLAPLPGLPKANKHTYMKNVTVTAPFLRPVSIA